MSLAEDKPSQGDHETQVGRHSGEQGNGEAAATTDIPTITGFKLVLLMVALGLASFIMGVDLTILATAVPTITDRFGALQDVSWYASSYFITISAFNPLAGSFFQSLPPKWVFLSYTIVFMIGSLVSALAPSSGAVIGGRVLMGVGASGILGGTLAIIGLFVSSKSRPAYIGAAQGIYIVAEAVGPLIGGAFTEYVTWRWCFYFSLPLGGAAAIFVFLAVPDKAHGLPKQTESVVKRIMGVDYAGFALYVGAILMLLLALQFGGNTYAWNSSTVIGLFVGSVVTLACFVAWQWRLGDRALIPPNVVMRRTVAASFVCNFLGTGAYQTVVYYLPIWFQSSKGSSAFSSGVMYLPTAISDLVAAVVAGGMISKLPYYNPFLLFGTATFAIGAGLYTTFTPATSEGKWIGYQILVGLGSALIIQVPIVAVQRVLPRSLVAIGSTTIVLAGTLGGAVLLAVADAIFQSQLRRALSESAFDSTTADAILGAGATGFRDLLSGQELLAAEISYNTAVTSVFYLSMASALGAWVLAWGLEWVKDPGESTE